MSALPQLKQKPESDTNTFGNREHDEERVCLAIKRAELQDHSYALLQPRMSVRSSKPHFRIAPNHNPDDPVWNDLDELLEDLALPLLRQGQLFGFIRTEMHRRADKHEVCSGTFDMDTMIETHAAFASGGTAHGRLLIRDGRSFEMKTRYEAVSLAVVGSFKVMN